MKFFECARCGNCCRQGGDLRLLPEDVAKIAHHFGMEIDDIKARYGMTNIDEKLFFVHFESSCPFLTDDNKCTLQGDSKPFFCANYIPFVDSEGSPIYKVCHGIGKGREWSEEEISSIYNNLIEHLVIRR